MFVFICAQIPGFVLEFILGAVTPQPISKVGVRYGGLQCLGRSVNCGSRNENFLIRAASIFSSLSSISDRLPFSCNGKTVRATTNVEYLWKQNAPWRSEMVLYYLFVCNCGLKLSITMLKSCMM